MGARPARRRAARQLSRKRTQPWTRTKAVTPSRESSLDASRGLSPMRRRHHRTPMHLCPRRRTRRKDLATRRRTRLPSFGPSPQPRRVRASSKLRTACSPRTPRRCAATTALRKDDWSTQLRAPYSTRGHTGFVRPRPSGQLMPSSGIASRGIRAAAPPMCGRRREMATIQRCNVHESLRHGRRFNLFSAAGRKPQTPKSEDRKP